MSTLLGDAAHLMSPFSGKGANLAMLDGAELALAVAAGPDLDAAVRAYEGAMLPRSIEAAQVAAAGLAGAIAADAPAHTVARMRALQSSASSVRSGRSREEKPASSE
ncbi:MAG TPA: FAD-dependent monooxygenase [Candidatus Dormibacteraeota bacterium]|nr:FAD-dependent monooxygenase [Candidatus Dormibacteraeota bacterium]